MLQQTTVKAVIPYFERFTTLWPHVGAMAAAPEDDILSEWAGLGYYSRARNLKRCADIVIAEYDGIFPQTKAELQKLPGIGDYTASAIAAIAFGENVAVVDGNIERVVSRFASIETVMPQGKTDVKAFLDALSLPERSGDFAQAMMDLGATICTPRRPACALCPINEGCTSFSSGMQDSFPVKAPKKTSPARIGATYIAWRADGALLLRKRGDKGLLAGMTEVPTTAWNASQDGDISINSAPFQAEWQEIGAIQHVFTHFKLALTVYRVTMPIDSATPSDAYWSSDYRNEAIPTVFVKAINLALKAESTSHD